MTYDTFLEEAYKAIRDEAPPIEQFGRLELWTLSIGEVLVGMPPELQREWAEQYAVLLVVKYGHIRTDIARVCIRHGLTEAEARWPKVGLR